MKYISFLLLIFAVQLNLTAQTIDFNQVIPPIEQKAKSFDDFLVQLAWVNNPDNSTLGNKVNIAKQEQLMSKNEWKNAVGLNLGISPFPVTDSTSKVKGVLVVPSFGVSANLGQLVNAKYKKNIALEKVKIAENDVNQQKLGIKAEVLNRYNTYTLSIEILKARIQAEQDTYDKYNLLAELFKENKVKFEDYNEAGSAYHSAVEAKIKAQGDINLAKIALEEIVGMSLEEAEASFRRGGL